ncbi:dienelactone hydrolase family protein [Corynebacterium timonense]|uniref:Alpha/beta hydrolase family protein n=1 Tax=Corynebacterium timonense TaxID=441500 RepID=A0A1H1SID4_9CORY|nr:dienelactone hydrolase family protein [Corynebacterium timonense]SDS47737.1 Alpha/beta hydrolase family protein [Corynebacterium timonense]
MSANLKKLSSLSTKGPHHVLEGDLGYTGLPGKVYAPEEGKNLPAVAFGHDWMRGVDDYHDTLRHLASWGIVVAAPDTETGLRPDHAGLAADLETTLQILSGVRLGNGNITVSPGKLGLAGHGMGGGAAVLAAVDNTKVAAVAAVYPAATAPSAVEAAREVLLPGMIIGPDSDSDAIFDPGNPAEVAFNWAGEKVYRVVKKGNQRAIPEDGLLKRLAGVGAPNSKVQQTVRGLLVGYFLHQLGGEKKYADFSAPDASGGGVSSVTGDGIASLVGFDTSGDALTLG